MRIDPCTCGQTLFFDNTRCVHCGRDAGWCETHHRVVAVEPDGTGTCGIALRPCSNRTRHNVCNRYLDAATSADGDLCLACGLNRTVPDLSIDGNRARWARLEAAKRRMCYDLRLIGEPVDEPADAGRHALPLHFEFKADPGAEVGQWRPTDGGDPVYTGHADGVITINLKETDDVERERTRINLGEPQRTLVGHFRHEVGHYFWEVLIKNHPDNLAGFKALFGDHENPTYSEALDRHYKQGAPADWRQNFVSAYATMHPWEDWAETWSLYLDIVSTLDTLSAHGITDDTASGFDAVLDAFARRSVVLNELTRNAGLVQLVPEVLTGPVRKKLHFVNNVVGR